MNLLSQYLKREESYLKPTFMENLVKNQKTLTLAQELYKIANVPAYNHVKEIFIKYGIDRFDPCKIQQLGNIIGITLAERVVKETNLKQ
jgi:hypothetical protein